MNDYNRDSQNLDGLAGLENRRISQDTIDTFKIECTQNGWRYPVPRGGYRCKAYDSDSNPKYWWESKKPGSAKLYHSSYILESIEEAGGTCWLVSGEADVWAMYSAGIHNVISGFGENHVIPDLAEILRQMGIKAVYIAPDLDETGRKWARKVFQCLENIKSN